MDGILIAVIIGLVILVPIIIIAGFLIVTYNNMVRKKNSVEEGWKQIHVQEQERLDSIGQLVNTVKGYADHEQGIFSKFADARGAFAEAMQNSNPGKMGDAHKQMDSAMMDISAVSEAYPELKANENFNSLQDQITSVERKIASARRYYNSAVREFNETKQVFPASLVAGMLGFKEDKEYFEIDEEAAREAPEINF